jgi:hypothetical protein
MPCLPLQLHLNGKSVPLQSYLVFITSWILLMNKRVCVETKIVQARNLQVSFTGAVSWLTEWLLVYEGGVWINFTRTNVNIRASYWRGFGFSFHPRGQLSWLWFFCGFAQPLTCGILPQYIYIYIHTHTHSGVILARENLNTGRKTCSIATLSTTNSTCADLGLNHGLCGLRLVTDHLLHVTACKVLSNLGFKQYCDECYQ